MAAERYRLVTRSDFDGLVCAVLLKALDLVDDIAFVHPKDVQDGMVPIGPGDITTNLPYSPQAHLVFDHHLSETLRNLRIAPNHVIDPQAPSAARVVYDYYGGLGRFRDFRISNYQLMMQLIDECSRHGVEEILRLPDVAERVDLYRAQSEPFVEQLRRCTSVRGTVAVVDLRPEETIHAGNRFVVYALYPDCSVSAHVLWGKQRERSSRATKRP